MADQNIQTAAEAAPGVGAIPQVDNFNPSAPTVGGDDTDVRSQMREWNARVEEKTGARQGEDYDESEEEIIDTVSAEGDEEGDEPIKPPVADDKIDAEEVAEEVAEEIVADENAEKKKTESGNADEDEIVIAADLPLDAFEERKQAYLDTVEITPQLQTILDRYETELEQARAVVNNSEISQNLISAFDRMAESDVVDGAVVPNVEPAVEAIRTLYKNEYPAFTTRIFESDSTKYAGMTVFEEKMFDELGATPDKLKNIVSYLESNDPASALPIPPPPTPKGVDAKLAEAYREVGEPKRFEIESLTKEIERLETELEEADEPYYKKQITDSINDVQAKLNTEINILARVQSGINSDRSAQEVQARQQTEFAQKIQTDVWNTHDSEMNQMLESFAAELAPRLSFVEGDAALSMSRNVLSRVNNALDFDVNDRMEMIPKPKADFFARQLKEEGIDFDFKSGRDLLHKALKLTDKLTRQKAGGASIAAIAKTEQDKANAFRDIKVEQKALLGQISQKYVKSSGKKLTDAVEDLQSKKVKARAVISKTNGSAPREKAYSRSDIAEYNRRHAAEIKNGDDLFNEYAEGDDE